MNTINKIAIAATVLGALSCAQASTLSSTHTFPAPSVDIPSNISFKAKTVDANMSHLVGAGTEINLEQKGEIQYRISAHTPNDPTMTFTEILSFATIDEPFCDMPLTIALNNNALTIAFVDSSIEVDDNIAKMCADTHLKSIVSILNNWAS